MPEPGLERDLNLKGAAIFVAPFSYRKSRPTHVARKWSWAWGNDAHENKDLKRVSTRFRCPQNFLLPMTLK
jgi:hypothetical protein